jgi:hypothetical protein
MVHDPLNQTNGPRTYTKAFLFVLFRALLWRDFVDRLTDGSELWENYSRDANCFASSP